MANVTIFEYQVTPNAQGDYSWPADVTTTIASTATHALGTSTRGIIVCSDADCRMIINGSGVATAASASTLPVLSAIPNQFLINAAAGQTLKFA